MRIVTVPPNDELRCLHCGKQAKKEKYVIQLENNAGNVLVWIYYCQDKDCNYLALELDGWY